VISGRKSYLVGICGEGRNQKEKRKTGIFTQN